MSYLRLFKGKYKAPDPVKSTMLDKQAHSSSKESMIPKSTSSFPLFIPSFIFVTSRLEPIFKNEHSI